MTSSDFRITMISVIVRTISLSSVLSLSVNTGFSQVPTKEPAKAPLSASTAKTKAANKAKEEAAREKERAAEAAAALRLRARSVLEGLVPLAESAENIPLSIRTRVRLADSLWRFDETLARKLFQSTFDAIEQTKLVRRSEQLPEGQTISREKIDLQNLVISAVARHDKVMAERLRANLGVSREDDGKEPSADAVAEKQMLRAVEAGEIAKENPTGATQMFREGIADGITYPAVSMLDRIWESNPTLGEKLFLEALARHDPATIPAFRGMFNLLRHLIYTSGHNLLMNGQDPTPGRLAAVRQFLAYAKSVLTARLAAAQAANLGSNPSQEQFHLGMILALSEKFRPEAAETVRANMNALKEAAPAAVKDVPLFKEPVAANPAELIAKAAKAGDGREKDGLFWRAAMELAKSNEFEAAVQAAEKVTNTDQRDYALAVVRAMAVQKSLEKNDLATAEAYATKIDSALHRSETYFLIVDRLDANKQRDRAIEMLKELRNWIANARNAVASSDALFEVAGRFAKWERPDEAFHTTRIAVRTLNTFVPPKTPSAYEYAPNPTNPDIEPLEKTFAPLAMVDFEMTLEIAREIDRKALSTFAQALTCQAVLAEKAKK